MASVLKDNPDLRDRAISKIELLSPYLGTPIRPEVGVLYNFKGTLSFSPRFAEVGEAVRKRTLELLKALPREAQLETARRDLADLDATLARLIPSVDADGRLGFSRELEAHFTYLIDVNQDGKLIYLGDRVRDVINAIVSTPLKAAGAEIKDVSLRSDFGRKTPIQRYGSWPIWKGTDSIYVRFRLLETKAQHIELIKEALANRGIPPKNP
jgi:hypothetical protein